MSTESCKQNCDPISALPPRALYVHVPFCRAKCRYCDFYSIQAGPELMERFAGAALAELRATRDLLELPLQSVFVGGGTPTVLGPKLLGLLLEQIRPLTDGHTEISVEANPCAFDEGVASALFNGGVNRLNFGVQSFRDEELALLGRLHRAQQARQAVEIARSRGFSNIGLDLIYGIPGQTLDSWTCSLRDAVGLQVQHLSCYALSFEPRTPLERDLQAGIVAPMDESLQRTCYEKAIQTAATGGLEHYEISNFARPPYQCKHNLTYWHNKTYLGIGPAAASYVHAVRKTNRADLGAYLESLEAARMAPAERETLSLRRRMAETMMLGLRLVGGLDRRALGERFGQDPMEAFPRSLNSYLHQGALVVTDDIIRLAPWALFVSDTILADIVAEASE